MWYWPTSGDGKVIAAWWKVMPTYCQALDCLLSADCLDIEITYQTRLALLCIWAQTARHTQTHTHTRVADHSDQLILYKTLFYNHTCTLSHQHQSATVMDDTSYTLRLNFYLHKPQMSLLLLLLLLLLRLMAYQYNQSCDQEVMFDSRLLRIHVTTVDESFRHVLLTSRSTS